jgi:uncharacterized protein
MISMSVIHNFPLLAALVSVFAAQFIKVPIHVITHRSVNLKLAFSTGGMPSSHSAAVAALAAAVGISSGFASVLFAIVFVFGIITMYDAAGIRRHAGTHASILNRMTKRLSALQKEEHDDSVLKEMLGHRPIEVLAGAGLGIAISLLLHMA